MKKQTGSCIGVTVNFTENMEARCEVHHAENDADCLDNSCSLNDKGYCYSWR